MPSFVGCLACATLALVCLCGSAVEDSEQRNGAKQVGLRAVRMRTRGTVGFSKTLASQKFGAAAQASIVRRDCQDATGNQSSSQPGTNEEAERPPLVIGYTIVAEYEDLPDTKDEADWKRRYSVDDDSVVAEYGHLPETQEQEEWKRRHLDNDELVIARYGPLPDIHEARPEIFQVSSNLSSDGIDWDCLEDSNIAHPDYAPSNGISSHSPDFDGPPLWRDEAFPVAKLSDLLDMKSLTKRKRKFKTKSQGWTTPALTFDALNEFYDDSVEGQETVCLTDEEKRLDPLYLARLADEQGQFVDICRGVTTNERLYILETDKQKYITFTTPAVMKAQKVTSNSALAKLPLYNTTVLSWINGKEYEGIVAGACRMTMEPSSEYTGISHPRLYFVQYEDDDGRQFHDLWTKQQVLDAEELLPLPQAEREKDPLLKVSVTNDLDRRSSDARFVEVRRSKHSLERIYILEWSVLGYTGHARFTAEQVAGALKTLRSSAQFSDTLFRSKTVKEILGKKYKGEVVNIVSPNVRSRRLTLKPRKSSGTTDQEKPFDSLYLVSYKDSKKRSFHDLLTSEQIEPWVSPEAKTRGGKPKTTTKIRRKVKEVATAAKLQKATKGDMSPEVVASQTPAERFTVKAEDDGGGFETKFSEVPVRKTSVDMKPSEVPVRETSVETKSSGVPVKKKKRITRKRAKKEEKKTSTKESLVEEGHLTVIAANESGSVETKTSDARGEKKINKNYL